MSQEVTDKSAGYRTALKSTTIFGGNQLILIIINIVRSKLIALLLGTVGIGLIGLYNSIISLISSISNLGLQTSAVKEIAYAESQGDKHKLSSTIKAIHRWVTTTGLLGMFVTIALSPLLSRWYFENNEYIIPIVVLSIIILLNALQQEYSAILQGTRQVYSLVRANIIGSLLALVVSIPFYYFFLKDGIVLAMVCTSLVSLSVSFYYAKKTKLIKIKQSYKDSFGIGLSTVKLGIAMSIALITVSVGDFILKVFITRNGGINDVGLYSAGWAINEQYLGLVFFAIAKDYYPRLSQICNKNKELESAVNQQGEISLLLLTPMIMFMLVFIVICVNILYSDQFNAAIPMIKWLLIGSFVKSCSWCISFVFLAKGDSKVFLFNELGIKFITLPAYLLGYHYGGLLGIGYAYTFNYVIYFLWVAIVAKKKYSIQYSRKYFTLFVVLLLCILSYHFIDNYLTPSLIVKCLFVAAISWYCLYELNKRIPIRSLFNRK